MILHSKIDLLRDAKLLLAAIQLKRTHGLLYALNFLEDHRFEAEIAWEVLGLLPLEQLQKEHILSVCDENKNCPGRTVI